VIVTFSQNDVENERLIWPKAGKIDLGEDPVAEMRALALETSAQGSALRTAISGPCEAEAAEVAAVCEAHAESAGRNAERATAAAWIRREAGSDAVRIAATAKCVAE
jgi:hypothetical protein